MSEQDRKEKVALVTGASSGIGKAAALGLAERGLTVVTTSRDPERGEAARDEIVRRSGNDRVTWIGADFASQAEVRRLAEGFRARHDRLDVLINNAGLLQPGFERTPDGVEKTFAVNHLAPFLLTNLLLERLKRSAPSRIVVVSSGAHKGGRMHFGDLDLADGYGRMKAYAQSKLANVLFARELARRLDGTGVTVNAMHPGVVATRIWNRHLGRLDPLSLFMQPFKLFMMRPRKSAEAVVRLATAPELDGVTGRYFNKKKEEEPAPQALDDEAARRLWEASEALVGQQFEA